jgi:sterol 14alpha-demethylase
MTTAERPEGGTTLPAPGQGRPPQLTGGHPLVGHALEFLSNPLALLERARNELGDVAAFDVANRHMVLLSGPRGQEAVFKAQDGQLSQREAYRFMVPVFGKSVAYDAPPARMREQLQFLIPALQEARMRTYGPRVAREAQTAIAEWPDQGSFDVHPFTKRLTTYTASACLLGDEFRFELTDEFADLYADLEASIQPLAFINANLPLPAFRRRDRARRRLVELISQIVDRRRARGDRGDDFLQTLMEAKYADGASLDPHEITGLILAALFAGLDTSAASAAWVLLELAWNPAERARVRDELDRVLGDGREVDVDALHQLVITERAIKEALRLHPPIMMLVRAVVQPFEALGFTFQTGTWLVVSPTIAHRIPELFPEPERFDPDRFAPDRDAGRTSYSYIPFGGGRHNCLGTSFAMLQLKTIVATILRDHDVEPLGERPVDNFSGLVVGPRSPARLTYRRRH